MFIGSEIVPKQLFVMKRGSVLCVASCTSYSDIHRTVEAGELVHSQTGNCVIVVNSLFTVLANDSFVVGDVFFAARKDR